MKRPQKDEKGQVRHVCESSQPRRVSCLNGAIIQSGAMACPRTTDTLAWPLHRREASKGCTRRNYTLLFAKDFTRRFCRPVRSLCWTLRRQGTMTRMPKKLLMSTSACKKLTMPPPSRKPLGLRQALSTGQLTRERRTKHGYRAAVGAHLFFTRAACSALSPPEGDTMLPRATGLRAVPGVPLARGSSVRLPACVGGLTLMERRKGRNMAKATRPQQRHRHPVRPCAWCAHPVHGDAVTVTFPDKAQVTFHIACLDQYRAVMWPWAAP
jgi:hypothetical protein